MFKRKKPTQKVLKWPLFIFELNFMHTFAKQYKNIFSLTDFKLIEKHADG